MVKMLSFGKRKILGMNYSRYVSLPKAWLDTNELEPGDLVKILLSDDGSLKIMKIDDGFPNRGDFS